MLKLFDRIKLPHLVLLLATAAFMWPDGACADDYKVVHAFKDPRLGYPDVGVTADGSGNLYGTLAGSNGTANPGKHCGKHCGGVYSILSNGSTKILYKFNLKDGATPAAPLISYNGSLYGTTGSGGNGNGCFAGHGCGVIFRLDPDGSEHVLHSFCSKPNCADGFIPSGVIADDAGNLYGETNFGGPNTGAGDIFRLGPNGTYKVLYAFCNQPNCTDGNGPSGGLIRDADGNLYGTTIVGGANGQGTVFRLDRNGTLKVLYDFCPKSNCTDGADPEAGLLVDGAGNFYSTTAVGGGSDQCDSGCGTVFKLAPDGTETVLHAFQSGSDGATPLGGLVADGDGNLYGTTRGGGGGTNQFCDEPTCGTVFKLAPSGDVTILHAFCSEDNCQDGGAPQQVTPVLLDDELYGTTSRGGFSFGFGVVWKVKK